MRFYTIGLLSVVVIAVMVSCKPGASGVQYSFDHINDRTWIGEDFWTVPLEDWKVSEGRLECDSKLENATLTVLPYLLQEGNHDFQISVRMGLLEKGENPASAGIKFGLTDPADPDPRAAIYFGEGLFAGVNTEGYAYMDQHFRELGEDFDFSDFTLQVGSVKSEKGWIIRFRVLDATGNEKVLMEMDQEEDISGIVQLVNNMGSAKSKRNADTFWFDDLNLGGDKFAYEPGMRFGPILWSMHTLSRQCLKLTAQFPPIGEDDNPLATLQVKGDNGKWEVADEEEIDPLARCASFKVDKWDDTRDQAYRIVYSTMDVHGTPYEAVREGTIRKDPVDRSLRMGAMTCQFWTGFPYTPVLEQLRELEPDIMYFSGDQIYEGNGGYPIKNFPDPRAINSYLGKWYMFGWVFGDLMRDVPVVTTPDDHDVFQGNLWGGAGIRKTKENRFAHDRVGFDQSIETVNAVNRTQCSHLPDPYDPTPIGEGMSVWYTDMVYGRVSFAILSDRIFKSGPNEVSDWEGRWDLIPGPLKDPSILHKPGLDFLGARQERFLEHWVRDWKGTDMKVLLSQTVFANLSTHHSRFANFLPGDLDSGGWPKEARDRAVRTIRKGYAFHIAGDQHLPTLSQYGVDSYRDGGWSFCTPAISVCFSRWFRPDELNRPVSNRPAHGLPNTGQYEDIFGNLNYMFAVGNPGDFKKSENRYEFENDKSSGLGFVIFDKDSRDITIESWKMLGGQHPGWPHSINQLDNYGRKAVAWLPTLEISGEPDPVLEVYNETSGELVYALRIKGLSFDAKVFDRGGHKIRIGYPESDRWVEHGGLMPVETQGKDILTIDFEE